MDNDRESRCCTSHSGQRKARYATLAIAKKVLKEAEKRRGVRLEIYPCDVVPGAWHLKKARS